MAHPRAYERDGYPGKCYSWPEPAVARLRVLLYESVPTSRIAKMLNEEYPEEVKLTKNSIVGKITRMRKARCLPPRPQRLVPPRS
jgi:hypothetical protein